MSEPSKRCHKCGSALEGEGPRGLCPVCILEMGLTPEPGEPEAEGTTDRATAEGILPSGPLPPGTKFGPFGDLELLEPIGHGGMGIIYKARQLSLNRFVAVKMIQAGPFATPEHVQRFHREAEAVASLEHPNIVPIYEVGEHQGLHYYTMRLVQGPDLGRELKRTGPFPARRAAELMMTVARAVHHAHQRGVLHRDLKPANILLDPDGQPHISDFGLAKLVARDVTVTGSAAMLGTPSYMSPEQASGRVRQLTTATDIYGLGAILYELLTGRPPFEADSTVELLRKVAEEEPVRPSAVLKRALQDKNKAGNRQKEAQDQNRKSEAGESGGVVGVDIDRSLETIVLKCLAKEPGRRYASAEALAEDLGRWLAGEPIHARRVRRVERLWLWCRRKPMVAGLTGALILTVVVSTVIAGWRIGVARESERREQYYASIQLADNHIENGDVDRALELLLKCPPEYRQWEWGHLMYLCHRVALTIPAHLAPVRGLVTEVVPAVTVLVFDPGGRRLATAGRDGTAKVWLLEDGRELFKFGGEANCMKCIAWHPSGSQLAMGGTDGTVVLWDTATWHQQSSMRLQSQRPLGEDSTEGMQSRQATNDVPIPFVSCLAYSPDGTKLAAAGRTLVNVWAIGSNKLLYRIDLAGTADVGGMNKPTQTAVASDRPQPVRKLWFSSDGQRLVVKQGFAVRIYEADTGRLLGSRGPVGDDYIYCLSDKRCEKWATIDEQNRLKLWQPNGHARELVSIDARHTSGVLSCFFSEDGRYLCSGGVPGNARVWDATNGEEMFAIPARVYQAAFSPDGQFVATIGAETMVRIWDFRHGKELSTLRGHRELVENMAYDQRGRLLATASAEGVVKIWSVRPGREILRGDCVFYGAAYSPDGRLVAAVTPEDYGLVIVDADSGRVLRRIGRPFHRMESVAFSPDGSWVITAGSDRTARIWDPHTGQEVRALVGHSAGLSHAVFSPDNRWIATCTHDGMANLYEARTGQLVHTLTGHSTFVSRVVFSSDSKRLATEALDWTTKVWDVESGRGLFTIDSGYMVGSNVRFSKDGRCLTTVGDGVIRSWSVRDGRLLVSWPGRGGFGLLCYSPDEQRMVLSSGLGSGMGLDVPGIELWDATTGRRILRLRGHTEVVVTGEFSPDGRRLLIAAFDETVRQFETFPWCESEYPGSPRLPLAERVQQYAREYWRKRIGLESAPDTQIRTAEQGENRTAPSVEASSDNFSTASPIRWGILTDLGSAVPHLPVDRSLWPRRDANATDNQIDLTDYYNGLIDHVFPANCGDYADDNHLGQLGAGNITLDNVQFDVRGVIQLRGLATGKDYYARRWSFYPSSVKQIQINRLCRRLHMLHGTVGMPSGLREGKRIGSYVLHYADGSQRELEIIYGRDVRDWWRNPRYREPEPDETDNAVVAWNGRNVSADVFKATLRLYLRTYENPQPEIEVTSMDFVSAMSRSAPFLVALTVEP